MQPMYLSKGQSLNITSFVLSSKTPRIDLRSNHQDAEDQSAPGYEVHRTYREGLDTRSVPKDSRQSRQPRWEERKMIVARYVLSSIT
jgi:hypothetical protein